MKIFSSDLINLPVYSESGQHLGRIDSFEIDVETHLILEYHIRTGLIKGLWHQQLIINRSQVISISKARMVVEDNVSKKPAVDLVVTPATK